MGQELRSGLDTDLVRFMSGNRDRLHGDCSEGGPCTSGVQMDESRAFCGNARNRVFGKLLNTLRALQSGFDSR